jgi:hypothetical protein
VLSCSASSWKLDAIVVPVEGSDDPPTPKMRDRAWQRFVHAGGLDLPPDSEPPPSGTRRTGRLTKLRKLGPLMAIFSYLAVSCP